MKKHRKYISVIFSLCAMLALILDSKTALTGASEGINLCIKTVIPSLLPMMVLSSLLTDGMGAASLRNFRPLNTYLGIPGGSEGILLAAAFGGYPVGAACISQRYKAEKISKQDANHLLRFCSNAGPAFIFGVCGHYFSSVWMLWLLWLINIVSAIITGLYYSHKSSSNDVANTGPVHSIADVLRSSVNNLSLICGWIVLFRVVIRFCQQWFLWLFSPTAGVILSGVLELTNGCCMLDQIADEQIRFILCSIFLSFGGICVILQTAAVANSLSMTEYLKGKLIQTFFSFLLSSVVGTILFSRANLQHKTIISFLVIAIVSIITVFFKKVIAFFSSMRYNTARFAEKG